MLSIATEKAFDKVPTYACFQNCVHMELATLSSLRFIIFGK